MAYNILTGLGTSSQALLSSGGLKGSVGGPGTWIGGVLSGIEGDVTKTALNLIGGILGQTSPFGTGTDLSSPINQDDASMIQDTSNDKESGAFRWLERYVTPDMFASADSCLLGIGAPIYNSNDVGKNFTVLGFCRDFSVNTQTQVYTFKEFRTERNIIIPLKSSPGSITLSRMLGKFPTFLGVATGQSKWVLDNQAKKNRPLFGLYIVFMSASRADTLCTLYAERCAVTNNPIGVQAGNFALYETVNIVFDRLRDDLDGTESGTAATKVDAVKNEYRDIFSQPELDYNVLGLPI